jgi:protein phosphatase
MGLSYGGMSDPGRLRRRNEDRWFADPGLGLFAVADGLGGVAGGEQAAQLVVDSLPSLLRKYLRGLTALTDSRVPERVLTAAAELCHLVRQEGTNHPLWKGMGTTVVFVLIWDGQALVGHMGDSRAYLLRSGSLELLTRDHSPVQRMLDRGEITPEQAAHHPSTGQLTRYVGMKVDSSPDLRLLELQSDDQLLLCTDGLTEMVSDDWIAELLGQYLPPTQACERLVKAANVAGGHDNITALAITVGSPVE